MSFHLGICPWGHLLRFRDEDLEANFILQSMRQWMWMDRIAGRMIVFIFPIKLMQGDPIDYRYYIATVLAWLCIPLILLYLNTYHNTYYERKRIFWASLARPVIAFGCMIVVLLEDVWTGQDTGQIFGRMISRSTIMDLLMPTIGLRLPFARHLPVQIVGTVVSLGWIVGLQNACVSQPDVLESIKTIGRKMDSFFGVASLFSQNQHFVVDISPFPCVVVPLFLHLFVGLIVPTVALYVMEVRSRANFLQALCGPNDLDVVLVKRYKRWSILKAILVVPIALIVCWLGSDLIVSGIVMAAEIEGMKNLLPAIGWSCCLAVPLLLSWFGVGDRMLGFN